MKRCDLPLILQSAIAPTTPQKKLEQKQKTMLLSLTSKFSYFRNIDNQLISISYYE